MYKASYADGQKWFEYVKRRPAFYMCYRVNGDGSTTMIETPKTKAKARKWVQFMNDNYATEGGRLKVFMSSDGEEFLNPWTFGRYNQDDEGFPLCNTYKLKVLPDEDDLCSLCGQHSASVTWNGKYATLEQLKIVSGVPL